MEDARKHDIALGQTNALTVKNQRQLRYAAGQKTISGRQSMSHRNGGGVQLLMAAAKNCQRKSSTPAWMVDLGVGTG